MISLNSAFKKIFGKELEKHGFVKIKGRQPYFVRVIGGEILHVIACRPEMAGIPSKEKGFDILAGVATVYRPKLDLSRSPRGNLNWLSPIRFFYSEIHLLDYQNEIWKSLCRFEYKKEDEESLCMELERAFDVTKLYGLPVLDKVTDLDSCIHYIERFQPSDICIPVYDRGKDVFEPTNMYENEGLLFIQADNHDDLREMTAEILSGFKIKIESGREVDSYEEIKEGVEKWRIKTIKRRDKIYNDPVIYARALKELKQRKAANLEALRASGLDI